MYSAAIVAAAFVAGVLGQNTTVSGTPILYTTVVETSFTTYCPAATVLTFNALVYTVTAETTLTITDCPCTLVKPLVPLVVPAKTVQYTSCPPEVAATVVYPAPVKTTVAPVPQVVETYAAPLTVVPVTVQAGAAAATGTAVQPASPLFTGAASQKRAGEMVIGVAAAVVALVL